MKHIYEIDPSTWPSSLKQIPDPPEKLYCRGNNPFINKNPDSKYICIVGSRKYSSYGKDACEYIIGGLRGLPVTIVSGLAMGIDSIAHEAALSNNLKTIAIPGSGLSEKVLYPRQNIHLAKRILTEGNAMISEYEPDFVSTTWAFPQRNRIMAGLSDIVLVIEGSKESGSMITARLGLDYNKLVCVVPGSIFSKNAEGPNYLLKQGAYPISSADDIRELLGFSKDKELSTQSLWNDLTDTQIKVAEVLRVPMTKAALIGELNWPAYKVQIVLMELEIKGVIVERGGELRLAKN